MTARGIWHTVNCKECSKEFEVPDRKIRVGKGKFCSVSCGVRFNQRKHGHTTKFGQSRTYNSWAQMRARCTNKNNPKFYLYGAQGIAICERWSRFDAFLEDMGVRPKGKSLDRIDGSEGYFPGNCRWATPRQQSTNIKTNVFYDFEGEKLTAPQLSRRAGVGINAMRYRIRNWPQSRWLEPKHI